MSTIDGKPLQQESSLEYMPRFSMCNCLTLRWPGTYTAHLMSTDLFVNKVEPGDTVLMPFANKWIEGNQPRKYKIPKKIDTFLFSPFNDITRRLYTFKNQHGILYTMGYDPRLKVMHKYVDFVHDYSIDEYRQLLNMMHAKVNKMWPDAKKILIFYDASRAVDTVEKRLRYFNAYTKEVLKWPSVQVVGPKTKTKTKTQAWTHYSNVVRNKTLNKIKEIENDST